VPKVTCIIVAGSTVVFSLILMNGYNKDIAFHQTE
jgi:hypothetical protein